MLMTYIAEYTIFFSHVWQQHRLICKVTDKTFLAESLELFHNATCDAILGPISI